MSNLSGHENPPRALPSSPERGQIGQPQHMQPDHQLPDPSYEGADTRSTRPSGSQRTNLSGHGEQQSLFNQVSDSIRRAGSIYSSPTNRASRLSRQLSKRISTEYQHPIDEIIEEEVEPTTDEHKQLLDATDGAGCAGAAIGSGLTSVDPEDTIKATQKRRGYMLSQSKIREKTNKNNSAILLLGRAFDKVVNVHMIVRYFVYWFPLAAILFVPLAIGMWRQKPLPMLGNVSLGWLFFWVEVSWLSFWITRVVTHYIPYAAKLILAVFAPSHQKFAIILAAVENPLALVFWALCTFLTFQPMMTGNPIARERDLRTMQPWMTNLNHVLSATLISLVIYFGERVLIQLISLSYHERSMAKRIQSNNDRQDKVRKLYDASLSIFPQFHPEFEDLDQTIQAIINFGTLGGNIVARNHTKGFTPPSQPSTPAPAEVRQPANDGGHHSQHSSGGSSGSSEDSYSNEKEYGDLSSSSPGRPEAAPTRDIHNHHHSRLISGAKNFRSYQRRIVGHAGHGLKTTGAAIGHAAKGVIGGATTQPKPSNLVVRQALQSKYASRLLGQRIWQSMVLEGNTSLYVDDLIDILGPDREKEARELFEFLDADSNGDVSMEETENACVSLERDCKLVVKSLKDVNYAISELHSVLRCVVLVIAVFVFISQLSPNLGATLATTGTSLLALSFIITSAAQEFMGSVIFLFAKHPLDIGDLVDIGGTWYTVKSLSLLYTSFIRITDGAISQVSNSVLNTVWTNNFSRASSSVCPISVQVNHGVTDEQIGRLSSLVNEFVDQNSRYYSAPALVGMTDAPQVRSLSLYVVVNFRFSYSDSCFFQKRHEYYVAIARAMAMAGITEYHKKFFTLGDSKNPIFPEINHHPGEGTFFGKRSADNNYESKSEYSNPSPHPFFANGKNSTSQDNSGEVPIRTIPKLDIQNLTTSSNIGHSTGAHLDHHSDATTGPHPPPQPSSNSIQSVSEQPPDTPAVGRRQPTIGGGLSRRRTNTMGSHDVPLGRRTSVDAASFVQTPVEFHGKEHVHFGQGQEEHVIDNNNNDDADDDQVIGRRPPIQPRTSAAAAQQAQERVREEEEKKS